MALRLRRGTNAERLTIIPQEGELIYTTDTKELYAGDGSTIGGLRVTGSTEGSPAALTQDLDLASNNITGIGSIDITGTVTANFDGDVSGNVLGDLTGNVTGDVRGSVFGDNNTLLVDAFNSILSGDVIGNLTGDVRGSVFGDDSTLLVDAVNNKLTGNLTGDVFGNDGTLLVDAFNSILSGDLTGNVIGDVQGSVFGDDSTLLVDGVNNTLSAGTVYTDSIEANNRLVITSSVGSTDIEVESVDDRSILKLTRTSQTDISTDDVPYGSIFFARSGFSGDLTTGLISGRNNSIVMCSSVDGTFPESSFLSLNGGQLGVGTTIPTSTLDVRGSGVFTGEVVAAAFKGTLVGDDSSIIIDGISGAITAPSYIQFGSFTTAERDALIASNGMVVYNTTDNKFQGYENGAWVNLV